MKRVSTKMFFSVVWRGICQVLGWFFGLFGYKRDGKFAKCVWGMFATSSTIIVTLIAGLFVYDTCQMICKRNRHCEGEDAYYNVYISQNLMLHDHGDGKAWIKNVQTGKKILTDIAWISKPHGAKDSLIVFSDGENRGYFNKYTGEVVIPNKYKHAWRFSDGIASVEENGIIKFIDAKGNQVFDRTFVYDPEYEGHVFHAGYCVVDEDGDNKYGLMNAKGVTVLPEEYTCIRPNCRFDYWILTKENESCVVDRKLKTILPMMPCEINIEHNGIEVTMADNTIRKYDVQGNLIDDFYINDLEYLEYELEETYQINGNEYDDYNEEYVYVSRIEHKTARARLCKYTAGNDKEGLMTPEGHMVTLPKYDFIEAKGPDTYLCAVGNGVKEVINSKGEKVK